MFNLPGIVVETLRAKSEYERSAKKIADQVNAVVGRYRTFLEKTLLFTDSTLTSVNRAETLRHLCDVVQIGTLQSLTQDVRSLINELRKLESDIRAETGSESNSFSFGGFGLLSGSFSSYFMAELMKMHLQKIIKQMLGMEENLVLLIGKKIEKNLLAIAEQQAKIEGIHSGINGLRNRDREQELRIVHEQKMELRKILVETRDEVNRGFEIISDR